MIVGAGSLPPTKRLVGRTTGGARVYEASYPQRDDRGHPIAEGALFTIGAFKDTGSAVKLCRTCRPFAEVAS